MDPSALTVLPQPPLLQVRMQLDLVDGRLDGAFLPEDLEVMHIKVGDADGPDLASLGEGLHVLPGGGEVPVVLDVAGSVGEEGEHGRFSVGIHGDRPGEAWV